MDTTWHNYTQLWDTSFALITVSFNQHWSQHWIPFPKPYSFEGNPCNMDGNSMQIPSISIRLNPQPEKPKHPCNSMFEKILYIIQIWDDLGCSLWFFFPFFFRWFSMGFCRFLTAKKGRHRRSWRRAPPGCLAEGSQGSGHRSWSLEELGGAKCRQPGAERKKRCRKVWNGGSCMIWKCYIDDNLIYIIFVLFTSVVLFFM